MVACMIDDPALVTREQMESWRADFDNWGIVDTGLLQAVRPGPGRSGDDPAPGWG